MHPLEYGQTPWDNLSREELLREVQRMYACVLSANSVMNLCRDGEVNPFWREPSALSYGGRGGRAMGICKMVLEPLHQQYSSEDIFRCFFRYANDLLFSPEYGFNWSACDGCPHLYGNTPPQESLVGKPCVDCAMAGRKNADGQPFMRRLIAWKDLQYLV